MRRERHVLDLPSLPRGPEQRAAARVPHAHDAAAVAARDEIAAGSDRHRGHRRLAREGRQPCAGLAVEELGHAAGSARRNHRSVARHTERGELLAQRGTERVQPAARRRVVRLHDSARPQTHRGSAGPGGGDRGPGRATEQVELLVGPCVPHPHRRIVTAGDEPLAVSREGKRADRSVVARQSRRERPVADQPVDAPQPDRPIGACTCDDASVGAPRQRRDGVRVAEQEVRPDPGGDGPDADTAVFPSGREQRAVRAERESLGPVLRVQERPDAQSGVGMPDGRLAAGARCRQEPSVRRERDVGDPRVGQHAHEAAVPREQPRTDSPVRLSDRGGQAAAAGTAAEPPGTRDLVRQRAAERDELESAGRVARGHERSARLQTTARADVPCVGDTLPRSRHDRAAASCEVERGHRLPGGDLAGDETSARVDQENAVGRHSGRDQTAVRRQGDGSDLARQLTDDPQPVGGQRLPKHVLAHPAGLETSPCQGEPDTLVRIDGQLLQRGRLEYSRVCVARLRLGARALRERPRREPGDDPQCDERRGEEDVHPPLAATRADALALEAALLPPRADRLGEDVVEDLVAVGSVDAVHDPVAGQRRQHPTERVFRARSRIRRDRPRGARSSSPTASRDARTRSRRRPGRAEEERRAHAAGDHARSRAHRRAREASRRARWSSRRRARCPRSARGRAGDTAPRSAPTALRRRPRG